MINLSAAPLEGDDSEVTYRSPLMDLSGAVAAAGPDQGVAWHYGDPMAEQRILARDKGVVDQSHLAVITVSGPDRMTWLHNILSQDFQQLATNQSIEALVLDAQGRIENGAFIIDDGDKTWLITERKFGTPLVQWLERMKFMSQVEVSKVDHDWAVLAFNDVQPDAAAAINWVDPWPHVAPGGTRYGVPTPEHPAADRTWRLSLYPRAQLMDTVQRLRSEGYALIGTWASEALRIEHLRPRLTIEVDHKSIPHELDWLRTAVHLHKGCYRGQETVARVHNLGRPPRRLVLLHIDGSHNVRIRTGDSVRTTEKPDREIGTVRSFAQHWELGPVALGYVKRSTPADAALIIETVDGETVTANQEIIVSPDGVTEDRPAPRGPLTRGLSPRQL